MIGYLIGIIIFIIALYFIEKKKWKKQEILDEHNSDRFNIEFWDYEDKIVFAKYPPNQLLSEGFIWNCCGDNAEKIYSDYMIEHHKRLAVRYNATTTYQIADRVYNIDNKVYASKKDGNIGHILTDTNYWKYIE